MQNPWRLALLLRPAEAEALEAAAQRAGSSKSNLVTMAVERHYGVT